MFQIKKHRRGLAITAAAVAAATMFAGCGSSNASASVDTSDDGKLMTVDVYDDLANFQGIQSGWYAKIIKDKFNMKLNIIAPNVSGGSTTFDTRSAAGNLGDIIITSTQSGRPAKLIKSKLIADMTPYMSAIKGTNYIKKYQSAVDSYNSNAKQKSGYWGIPYSVSSNSPTESSEANEPTFGPYLMWNYYKELGYPKISTLEDLLPVLQKMQKLARKETGSNKVYALSLFKDWDGNMMNNAKQPTCYYGFDELGFVLAQADGSDYQSVTKEGGIYERVIKFFEKANSMGLVDPESSTQNYDTMYAKYQKGNVLFSFWPWLGQAAYNTTDNKKAGKGFMLAPLQDQKIFSYGATTNGGTAAISIGSQAKNKSRLVKFINWLYSPEGTYDSGAQTNGTAGPKGLTWEIKDGKPVLTEFGEKALNGGGANVPASWGGGSYTDGVSALNYPAVLAQDTDPDTGYTYNASQWPSQIAKNNTALDKDWQQKMGAKTTMEYLQKNKMITVAPGASYSAPEDSSEIATLRGQIKTQIINYSWKAAMSKSDSEVDSLFKQMRSTVDGLGFEKVLKIDMANAKAQNKMRVQIKEEWKDKK